LDKNTGQTRWITPGGPAAYGAFVSGALGGCTQVIGYDQRSLGGWNPHTGQRLWTLIPSKDRDFNVPTPILTEGGIIVATENNGTRLHGFGKEGQIVEEPIAQFESLAPDTTTPVLTNGRVFGMSKEKLYCLDAKTLRPIWIKEEEDLGDHASLIADDERVLVMTMYGELILLDATANEARVLSRSNLFEEDVEVYAHPALVGSRLYARGGTSVLCVDLSSN
jgi:outer membrane protein assembly factor BamB